MSRSARSALDEPRRRFQYSRPTSAASAGCSRAGPAGTHHARLPGALVEKDLDAIVRPALPAGADAPHRALDVLAGAEAVGGEVTAPAGVDPLLEGSDLHHVTAAAR